MPVANQQFKAVCTSVAPTVEGAVNGLVFAQRFAGTKQQTYF